MWWRTNKQPEAKIKPNPEKKKTVITNLETEADKDDLAVGITEPSQPTANYKQPNDSIGGDGSIGVKAPAAIEKRSVAADDKENEGLSSKKEDALNNRQRENYFNGRVKDANNNPLPFANITNTRDNVGTYADAQGRFTLVIARFSA